MQTSAVQSRLSAGRSASSTNDTTLPWPSQTLRRQSPAVWAETGRLASAKVKPQTPTVQALCAHSVSTPGQSVATLQPTH